MFAHRHADRLRLLDLPRWGDGYGPALSRAGRLAGGIVLLAIMAERAFGCVGSVNGRGWR